MFSLTPMMILHIMMIHLKCSKTDPFEAGFMLLLGCKGNELCPIAAMLGYLVRRPPNPGFSSSFRMVHLSWAHLCQELRLALMITGVDTTWYIDHSFHIRAATTAAQVGLTDSFIHSDSWPLEAWRFTGTYSLQPVNPHQCVGQTC